MAPNPMLTIESCQWEIPDHSDENDGDEFW